MLGLLICVNHCKCIVHKSNMVEDHLQVHLCYHPPFWWPNLSLIIFQLLFKKVNVAIKFIPFKISSFFAHLSPSCRSFATSLSSIILLSTYQWVLYSLAWKHTMHEEMDALRGNHTWDLIELPFGKQDVGCRWDFVIKHNLDYWEVQCKFGCKRLHLDIEVDCFETLL